VLALIRDPLNQVLVSAASAWELATKHRIGKYPEGARVIPQWNDRLADDRFGELSITAAHALRASSLPGKHRDPFDRMLAAQGILEEISVATPDPAIAALGAEKLW
jgi:PIN domain nuclease of toxin-antitoxin system